MQECRRSGTFKRPESRSILAAPREQATDYKGLEQVFHLSFGNNYLGYFPLCIDSSCICAWLLEFVLLAMGGHNERYWSNERVYCELWASIEIRTVHAAEYLVSFLLAFLYCT